MIEINDINKKYQDTAVLNNINESIPSGGVTSIIGPNGAGKSTLLSIMSRLLAPDIGSVRFNGLDVAKTSGDKLATILSVLRQENHFTIRLTVADLVSFGRYPYSRGRLN